MESNQPSKVSGYAKEAGGAIKENVGWAMGSTQMQKEGLATKKEGEAEVNAARTQQYGKGVGEQITGGLKEGAGKLTGDDQLKYEGKSERVTGETRKDFNS